MLYIVAIAICGLEIPPEDCSNLTAGHLERHWIYRPSIELCVEYARDVIATSGLDLSGRYPKVFCMRAETFEEAHSIILVP